MNSKIFLVLRILLGISVIVFGLNKFLNFIPFGEAPEAFGSYMGSLKGANVIYLVGIVEIVSGLAFIFNKYGALMALILMSVSINAVMAHAAYFPEEIGGAIGLLVFNIAVLFGYKNQYKSLLCE